MRSSMLFFGGIDAGKVLVDFDAAGDVVVFAVGLGLCGFVCASASSSDSAVTE